MQPTAAANPLNDLCSHQTTHTQHTHGRMREKSAGERSPDYARTMGATYIKSTEERERTKKNRRKTFAKKNER
jgi:hypothetical protein